VLPLPLGETTGGQGVPGVGLVVGVFGDVPLLGVEPFVVPGVDGEVLGFEDPGFAVEPAVPFIAPGKLPHGEPLGEMPGLFGLFVDGCVVLPGATVGEFEPGATGVVLGVVVPGT